MKVTKNFEEEVAEELVHLKAGKETMQGEREQEEKQAEKEEGVQGSIL